MHFPFIPFPVILHLFRIVVALLLAAHGCARLYEGSVDDFGSFLSSKGWPAGGSIAWLLTFFEIAGGLCMAAGFFVKWIALVLLMEVVIGIILVHAQNGWFVVGHQSGGVEYSVLLIFSLLLLIAKDCTPSGNKNL